MEERRNSPRVELDLNLNVNFAINANAPLKNLSESGICIKSNRGFDSYFLIAIELLFPGVPVIETFGKVVWSRLNPDGSFDTGVEFRYVAEDDRARLLKFRDSEIYKKTISSIFET
jgi:hypothetical protein